MSHRSPATPSWTPSRRQFLTAAGATAAAAAIGAGPAARRAEAAAGSNVLYRGERLTPGQSLWSTNNEYRFIQQTDGSLVLYRGSQVLWDTATWGNTVGPTVFQPDGNLVQYNATGLPIWASGTQGQPGASLTLQDDGNLVMHTGTGRPVWATNTWFPGNFVLDNLPLAFGAVPEKGRVRYDFSYGDTGTDAHIQGMGTWRSYALFTHNRTGSSGYWAIGDLQNNSLRRYDIAQRDPAGVEFRHPGGFQIIGDHVVVGVEHNVDDNTSSYLQLYSLRNLSNSSGPVKLAPTLYRTDGGAACVGIARVGNDYVTAVYTSYDNGRVDIYRSSGHRLDEPAFSFGERLYSFWPRVGGNQVGYDNLNLHTDGRGGLYLIGFRAETKGGSYEDYADLLKLELDKKSYTTVSSRHMYSVTRGLAKVGSHFRWGAGTQALDNQKLFMYCSSRIFTGFATQWNSFD